MKKTLILLLSLLLVSTSFAKGKKIRWFKKKKQKIEVIAEPINLMTNDVDSMSYALATNIANDLLKNLETLPFGLYNKDLFIVAFNTVMDGDSTLLSQDESNEFLQNYFTLANLKMEEQQKSEGRKFLEENLKNPAVQSTESGLQYIILTVKDGPKPQPSDKVRVHYEGALLDGTVFDSSYQRGEPIEFFLDQVIKGWSEGVQLMSEGSKYKLFIPYELGYGQQGAGGVIPPYSTLVFTVELLDINPVSITDQIKQLEIQ